MTIRTVDGLDVVLDGDHWKTHILKVHPELTQYRDLVIETLEHPEGVYRSKRDQTSRIYARSYQSVLVADTLVERVSLRVVVREENSFVLRHISPRPCGGALAKGYGLRNRATI